MADKQNTVSYDSIMKELRAGNYRPVYLLAGEEPYYIDKIADYIAENVLKPDQRDFNQTILYGLDTTPSQVMDSAHAAPVMAGHQVIIVREAQLMRGIEQMEKYLRRPIPSTILVLCYKKEPPKSRKGWAAEADKNGIFFESRKLRESNLAPFVVGYLKQKGVDIDPKASAMICDSIGADLSRIVTELDKLLLSMPERERRIVPEFVEQQIGISKDYNVFELRDAIVRKDVMKANRIAKYFDSNPKAANLHMIVPQLFSFFQNMMIAWYCPHRTDERELSQWLDLRGVWQAREYIAAMSRYNAVKVMHIIRKLRTVAAKSNGLDSRNATEGELLQELIYFILH
ncbi:MAG: DNA polymerase III subunit delta [Prevotella sp.]